MNMPRSRHSSAACTLVVKMTTEWCAAALCRCFWVRLSGVTCSTWRFLVVFSSSSSSLSIIWSSVLGSRSFLGTPWITSPYLHLLTVTLLNIAFQSILSSSWGSLSDSQWSLYVLLFHLLTPWILGMCPSLNCFATALWHFCIRFFASEYVIG